MAYNNVLYPRTSFIAHATVIKYNVLFSQYLRKMSLGVSKPSKDVPTFKPVESFRNVNWSSCMPAVKHP